MCIRDSLRPSTFVLNDKKWNIERDGELIIRNNFLHASNIHFTQGFQEISAETEEEDGGNTNNLNINLKNVYLGDITSMFFKNPRMEGISSGDVVLRDFFGKFNAEADLKTEQFRMDEDSVGLVNITAKYNDETGLIPFTVRSENDGYHVKASGSYNVKDSVENPLKTDIQLENTKVNILHRFIGDIFSDITGTARGNLSINGNPNSPDLLGKLSLRKACLLYTSPSPRD